MATSHSLMNRDTLFTLCFLYKSKPNSLGRKGNYSSHSSQNYPKFNKAADPCSAALVFLRALLEKISVIIFVVRLVIIFKVKTLLHNKHFAMPESSTLPCYIREFTG